MDRQKNGDDANQLTEYHVQLHRTDRRYRFASILVVCLVVAFSVWQLRIGVVAIFTRPDPPWLTILLAIITAIALPSTPVAYWIFRFRLYMRKDHQRVIELETQLDPNRQSSGISKEGKSPHE